MLTKNCHQCRNSFTVTDDDLAFYDKVSPVFGGVKCAVPMPSLCPQCRQQRRLSFRNERNLYHRKCDMTGKQIVSIYSPDVSFPVYEPEAWFSDGWDATQYGRDFDFNRPFFEQFAELQAKVPKLSLHVMNLENSPYVNQCWYTKNSHLCFDMGFVEDALYCYATYHSKNVVDTTFVHNCEFGYSLIDCQGCTNSFFLQNCNHCYDSFFSFDCHGSNNLAFCFNLRNKNYHIFNKPVSKEEFEKFLVDFRKGSRAFLQQCLEIFRNEVLLKAVHKFQYHVNSENCTGNYLLNSKNLSECYDMERCQDARFCTRFDEDGKDMYDVDHGSFCELCYEGTSIAGYQALFGVMSLRSNRCFYFHTLQSCEDCFGCISLKKKRYCILNKQYTKEEYEVLVPKIIGHMKKTGEWGEFFPVSLSPFSYNESVSSEYFPLEKEAILQRGWKFREKDPMEYQKQKFALPDLISETSNEIVHKILACKKCEKNYKIIQLELQFYRERGLPIPEKCPQCRHIERKNMRCPRKLFSRLCSSCACPLQSTYSPDRPEKVYCEKCYLEAVY